MAQSKNWKNTEYRNLKEQQRRPHFEAFQSHVYSSPRKRCSLPLQRKEMCLLSEYGEAGQEVIHLHLNPALEGVLVYKTPIKGWILFIPS